MKIASMGPNGVVPAQSDTQSGQIDIVDYPDPVAPVLQETPVETNNPNQEGKKFSRIFDLIQAAQKNGKIKDSPKEKKKMRAMKKYLVQKEATKEVQTVGTLFKGSA
jgi:hypothetical protein